MDMHSSQPVASSPSKRAASPSWCWIDPAREVHVVLPPDEQFLMIVRHGPRLLVLERVGDGCVRRSVLLLLGLDRRLHLSLTHLLPIDVLRTTHVNTAARHRRLP